ncbi:MAG: DNA-binding transcriptional regulator Fis [Betaproteobacteria bacterium]|jgi:Fis family transcriptional regulator|nr:DNA-binding transcriptional regulator Fis [Nitrosomonadales bacterium]NCV37746.1 DNA-binding transcriptional regulator Fis [Betaproteobacteria bacterium]NCV53228.1 DNA-binding transcriptional regulator Fis [Betaproteobacteria bacterium]NCX67729.1 DNA-binding transcriptional regulator Fis [Betaproteobacteria bacterium]
MGKNLQDKIETLLDNYFKDLDGEKPNDVYNMVLHSVEKPLLIYIMNYAQGNQTKAAKILGLNRNTLRKKLEFYNLNY